MSTFVTILVAVLIFGVLIMTHEYGHFLAARRCGVDVLEFSVGMGPLIWKKKKGETQYSVRLLPIGGYCRMKGEEGDEEGNWEAEGCLYAAPPAKRMIIMAAGSVLFYFSDLMLVLRWFADAPRIASDLCLMTYFPAQGLLAASVYFHANKEKKG